MRETGSARRCGTRKGARVGVEPAPLPDPMGTIASVDRGYKAFCAKRGIASHGWRARHARELERLEESQA